MSSRLLTSVFMRSADSPTAVAISAASPPSSGRVSLSASARPTSTDKGVRRSWDIADNSELRRRSDSICTVVSWAIWM
ncbi:hypothetical protein D3C81_2053640 [compost metagenome]